MENVRIEPQAGDFFRVDLRDLVDAEVTVAAGVGGDASDQVRLLFQEYGFPDEVGQPTPYRGVELRMNMRQLLAVMARACELTAGR